MMPLKYNLGAKIHLFLALNKNFGIFLPKSLDLSVKMRFFAAAFDNYR